MDPEVDGQETAARLELSAVDSARQAAVDGTRRPSWLIAAFAIVLGLSFGFALLRTPAGWIVGSVVFVLGMVGFLVVDHRMRRRRGRLMNFSGGNAARFLSMYAVMFVIGQLRPSDGWQPWFSIVAGAIVALMGYVYLRWDDVETARRLATGDFDAHDLMP